MVTLTGRSTPFYVAYFIHLPIPCCPTASCDERDSAGGQQRVASLHSMVCSLCAQALADPAGHRLVCKSSTRDKFCKRRKREYRWGSSGQHEVCETVLHMPLMLLDNCRIRLCYTEQQFLHVQCGTWVQTCCPLVSPVDQHLHQGA